MSIKIPREKFLCNNKKYSLVTSLICQGKDRFFCKQCHCLPIKPTAVSFLLFSHRTKCFSGFLSLSIFTRKMEKFYFACLFIWKEEEKFTKYWQIMFSRRTEKSKLNKFDIELEVNMFLEFIFKFIIKWERKKSQFIPITFLRNVERRKNISNWLKF